MKTETIKFALMSDPHFEIMNDGKKRLDDFLQAAEKADVDFIIHCGDFTYPIETTKCECNDEDMPVNIRSAYEKKFLEGDDRFLKEYNSFGKPSYHVLGNHEFDFQSVEEAVKRYGMEANYYSFHKKGWHFIVLDANYIKTAEGKYEHYAYAQYFGKDLSYLPPEQLKWLEDELMTTNEPVVIFSHQPLFGYLFGIKNYDDFLSVIEKAKKSGKKVRICINGHVHVDDLDEKNGTLYYNVNSMSNMWVGPEHARKRFSDEIERNYPSLRYIIPYKNALYAIVELSEQGITVKGKRSAYLAPGPKEVGYKGKISPTIRSWTAKW